MTDSQYMQLALDMAKATLRQTSPNPCVGALIVKNGKLLSVGVHVEAGGPHAEINAINMVANKSELAGATLYTTLEPCCYVGKTTQCTQAIIENKIKRVVIGTKDINPLVFGKGIEQLKRAKIEVTVGVLEQEARQINEKFFHYIYHHTPYVTLKAALSLDGKLATSTGESRWITNEKARLDAHYYRSSHDGILVGINTIIVDNPLLTARLPHEGRNPIRIILDTYLRISKSANVIQNDSSRTIIITGCKYDQEKVNLLKSYSHVKIFHLNTLSLDLHQVLHFLGQQEISSILVEGGQSVHNSFIQNKIFNKIVMYVSPVLIGGTAAPTFFTGAGFAHLDSSIKLKFENIVTLDDNIKIVAEQI